MLRRDSARICPRDRCQVSKPLYNPNPDYKKKKQVEKITNILKVQIQVSSIFEIILEIK
jgi:hypothetical protein